MQQHVVSKFFVKLFLIKKLFSRTGEEAAHEATALSLQDPKNVLHESVVGRDIEQKILENIPLGACLLDSEKKIVIWNHMIELLSGLSRSKTVGRSITELSQPWQTLLMRILSSHEKQLRNIKLESSGQPKWLNLHKTVHDMQGSSEESTLILIEDITEQYLLAVELAHSERLAAIGRLAGGVAHEIGNPITAIACLTQNLEAEQTIPEIYSFTQQILQQTQRVANILHSLIHFSQQSKQDALIKEIVNIYQTAEEAIHLIQLSAKGKLLHYHNTCEPQVHVIGDSQRLLQVFVHLLENAKDASVPHQTITLSTRAHSRYVEITIRDQGCGIPNHQLNRIFDPFFTTKPPGQGCGLGLPLSFNILKEHDGHIYIDSVQNQGTQVIIKLPLAIPA